MEKCSAEPEIAAFEVVVLAAFLPIPGMLLLARRLPEVALTGACFHFQGHVAQGDQRSHALPPGLFPRPGDLLQYRGERLMQLPCRNRQPEPRIRSPLDRRHQ